jgi:hypothetical protein
MNTETIKVQFAASYIIDCCRKVREFVIEIPQNRIKDCRDIEAAIIRHARNYPPQSEHVVNFEGFRSDWSLLPADGALVAAKPWARWVHCKIS